MFNRTHARVAKAAASINHRKHRNETSIVGVTISDSYICLQEQIVRLVLL